MNEQTALNDNAQKYTWQDSYFAKNWLAAVPLVRSVGQDSWPKSISMFFRDSFMLGGGAIGMVFNHLLTETSDNAAINIAKSTGFMIGGMSAGMFVYNNLEAGVKALADCCNNISDTQHQDLSCVVINSQYNL